MSPWYLNYNNYPNQKYVSTRTLPTFNFTGQKIRGEVIDASTGESLSFAKIAFSNNPNINVVSDFEGKFEITVPNGENYLNASFVGYDNNQQYINSPYIKFFLTPQGVELGVVDMFEGHSLASEINEFPVSDNTISQEDIVTIQAGKSGVLNKKLKSKNKFEASKLQEQKSQQQYAAVQIVQKDLRVEFTIQSKFSLKSDGFDQRVQIASNDLPSSYEYHSIPKIDPAVYLVAKVSGWEKLNLLNGESNIYFDGTFIGKSYLDVNTTKDTLAFSLGKDAKIQVLRTKISEKSKNKISGNRQKTDIAWEIKIRNNGGAEIPMLVKDQFPISQNEDIKIKDLDLPEGKKDENSGIITWDFLLPKNQSKTLNFSYTVDSQKSYILYVE
ncbi:MAG: mucoidy inhibitor MuiA family protein [Flavobacteriia bacterium]|nr:mucoidy inhibitor MuiA family protein [Flavobacteriia bacterium]